MSTFTEILSDPATGLDLASAMYVEGGPEATLHVATDLKIFTYVGSYETGFQENEDNDIEWLLPNVLLLSAR